MSRSISILSDSTRMASSGKRFKKGHMEVVFHYENTACKIYRNEVIDKWFVLLKVLPASSLNDVSVWRTFSILGCNSIEMGAKLGPRLKPSSGTTSVLGHSHSYIASKLQTWLEPGCGQDSEPNKFFCIELQLPYAMVPVYNICCREVLAHLDPGRSEKQGKHLDQQSWIYGYKL